MSTMVDLSNTRQRFNTKVRGGHEEKLFPSHSSGVEGAAMTSSKQREFLFSGILSIFIIGMPFFALLS